MANLSPTKKNRIYSIDLARGLAMILMALDHTRDYFHQFGFHHEATDLEHTSAFIFITRWITHFCAPAFIFLAGTSAFISGQRVTKRELSAFLIKRGLWLVILELTIVNFAWLFNPMFNVHNLQVIWAIGICMITLAGLIYLPIRVLTVFALVLIAGHNLLDSIHMTGNSPVALIWSILHEFGYFQFGPVTVFVAYPVIPWIGIISLGYCFGRFYMSDVSPKYRKRMLVIYGTTGILLFIILRMVNQYGDPMPWTNQPSGLFTLLSMLNVSKYPPSCLFALMTLPPLLLFLALTENLNGRFSKPIALFGRVPLFYYVTHLYLIHFAAMIAALCQGYSVRDMILTSGWITEQENLAGFGFSLPRVYLIWLILLIILYFPCRWYDRYKSTHRNWWLSYL